jgi:hypothetical protein
VEGLPELKGMGEEGQGVERSTRSLGTLALPLAKWSTLQTESQTFVKGQILVPDSSPRRNKDLMGIGKVIIF